MDLSFLPLVNAILNGMATVLLIVGWVLIKQGKRDAHRKTMITAFGISALFLVCYLGHKVWKAMEGGGLHTSYNGEGWIKGAYLLMLLTHVILAMAVPVFALILIALGRKERFELHKKIGRVALPIWLYVSITGVLVYLMLYPFNPPLAS
ncbi:MAG: hypothetical protein CMJ19_24430 [Phycisphaeraceae bacterium]|mgnify:CR=1 FL=1|nr:hypothetical protein [Phycisphaeraceae bacterium]